MDGLNSITIVGRPQGSSWAQSSFISIAPIAQPSTTMGKTVAGVPQGWEEVSPSTRQQTPEPVRVQADRPSVSPATSGGVPQSTGPAATGDGSLRERQPAVTGEAKPQATFGSEQTTVAMPTPKPPGILMNAYANTEATRTMKAYIDQSVTATPKPGTFDQVVSEYRSNPDAFKMDSSGIRDRSGEVGGRWNFGSMRADSLVIHHTAGRGGADGVIQTFTERNFPAHFIIDRDGEIIQVLGLDQKGQHTRPAQDGSGITNSNSWGVEVIARDDSDVLPVQAAATIRLANYLENYGLNPQRIVGHGAINSHKQATEGQSIVKLLEQIRG